MRHIDPDQTKNQSWGQKLSRLLAQRKFADALRYLDTLIEKVYPLFAETPGTLAERRMIWLCRIDLLRERGRVAEALAWTCLECEMYPDDVGAHALKEHLKRRLNLTIHAERRPSGSPQKADGWEGVAGMRELRAILDRDLVLPLQEPELYHKYRVGVPNGVLLYGPPGCGKTFIAQALAKRVGYDFIEVTPSTLASEYVHGTQKMIGELFADAAKRAPVLMFFDEFDAMAPDRSGLGVGHHYSTEVNEFLVQFNECAKRGICVIGATNYLKKIDPAVRRPGRLDKHFFVGPPDLEARLEALKLYMKDRPQKSIDWIKVADASEEYSFAELEHVVNESARGALADRRDIVTADLLDSIRCNPPSPKQSASEYQ